MAITIVASYCIPNSDLTHAVRLFRLMLLVATGIWGLWGFGGAFLLLLILTLSTETLDTRRPYLWPLCPLDVKALGGMLFRRKVVNKK